jgi:hypothetical protein
MVRYERSKLSVADGMEMLNSEEPDITAIKVRHATKHIVKAAGDKSMTSVIRSVLAFPTPTIELRGTRPVELAVPVRRFATDMMGTSAELGELLASQIVTRKLLKSGNQVFLGNGTTVYRVAQTLLHRELRLNVFTTNFELACLIYFNRPSSRATVDLLVVGRRELDFVTGSILDADVPVAHYHVAVIGFHTFLSSERAFYSRDATTLVSNNRAMETADRVILVAGAEKIDRAHGPGMPNQPLAIPYGDKKVYLVTDNSTKWGAFPGITIIGPSGTDISSSSGGAPEEG